MPHTSAFGADLSLVFAEDERPSVDAVVALGDQDAPGGFPFATEAFNPAMAEALPASVGALEIIANGLVFDVIGMRPAAPRPLPEVAHHYGVPPDLRGGKLSVITLRPNPHLSGLGNLLPVVRAMVGIGAALTALSAARAVIWHPARAASEPARFARLIAGWLAGGSFPALGLTALSLTKRGAMASEGLAFFIGQEIVVEPFRDSSAAALGKIAIRVIDRLMDMPAVTAPCEINGPDGELLHIEPTQGGRVLRIWREG